MIVKNPTQKTGGGFDDLIDRINERDADDPTGTKKPKKKEEKSESKKKGKGGFDGIIDNITERDNDDPVGTKKKEKKEEKEKEEKTPLDGITKTTTDLVTAGIGAVVGIGVMKGMSGMLNNK